VFADWVDIDVATLEFGAWSLSIPRASACPEITIRHNAEVTIHDFMALLLGD